MDDQGQRGDRSLADKQLRHANLNAIHDGTLVVIGAEQNGKQLVKVGRLLLIQ
jgi:hypothetical protein